MALLLGSCWMTFLCSCFRADGSLLISVIGFGVQIYRAGSTCKEFMNVSVICRSDLQASGEADELDARETDAEPRGGLPEIAAAELLAVERQASTR